MRYLETERLILRAVTTEDTQALFDIYGDPATNLYNPNGPYPSLEYARQRMASWLEGWAADGIGQWAVEKREEPGHVIGFGGLSYKDYGGEMRLNLGYRFATSAWGCGYASETARAAKAFAFDEGKREAIYGMVRPNNLQSIRVLAKQGFQQVGQLSDVPGNPPSLVFMLSRDDYARESGK